MFRKKNTLTLLSHANLEPIQISRMKFFPRIGNWLKPLTTFTITFILGIQLGSEYGPAYQFIF